MSVTRVNPHDMFSYEYRGLSTDNKPTDNVPNGSVFIEIDTSNVFLFDAENIDWCQQTSSGGSGNGGSGTDSEVKVVTLTIVVDSAEENASGSFSVDTTLGTTGITQQFECFVSDAFRIILCNDSGYFSYDTDCITIESYTGGILYDADENAYTITGDATIHVTLLDSGSYI